MSVLPTVPHGRPGLGVPVLPPIPNSTPATTGPTHHNPPLTSSSASGTALPSLPPPPYKARPSPPRQHREGPAPPPYTPVAEGQRSGGQSSPRQPARTAAAAIPPPVTPRTYKLSDPSVSLVFTSLYNNLKHDSIFHASRRFPSLVLMNESV